MSIEIIEQDVVAVSAVSVSALAHHIKKNEAYYASTSGTDFSRTLLGDFIDQVNSLASIWKQTQNPCLAPLAAALHDLSDRDYNSPFQVAKAIAPLHKDLTPYPPNPWASL